MKTKEEISALATEWINNRNLEARRALEEEAAFYEKEYPDYANALKDVIGMQAREDAHVKENKALLHFTAETLREQLQLLAEASRRYSENNEPNSLAINVGSICGVTDRIISLLSEFGDC